MRGEKEGRRSRAQVGAASVGLPPERDRGACKRFERREGAVAVPERLFNIPGGRAIRWLPAVAIVQEGKQEILHYEEVGRSEVLIPGWLAPVVVIHVAVAGQG